MPRYAVYYTYAVLVDAAEEDEAADLADKELEDIPSEVVQSGLEYSDTVEVDGDTTTATPQ